MHKITIVAYRPLFTVSINFAYTAKLLNEYHFAGDMFLHGIYDEDDMVRAKEHWLTASDNI